MPTILLMVLALAVSDVDLTPESDEEIAFFPTYAVLAPDAKTWNVHIHGWIYEPEEESTKRAIALRLFRKFLGIPEADNGTTLFHDRARMFLVDGEDDRQPTIRVGNVVYPAGISDDDGHFRTTLSIPARKLPAAGSVQRFSAVTASGDNRTFTGEFHLISPAGVSVISDIDDTIKITNVRDRRTLIANTFALPYKPVPGMAELYRRWLAQGAAFHYVSGSPWPLYPALADFLRANRFPAGSVHLRDFRWLDSSMLDMFGPPEKMKLQAIEAILSHFPRRQFILVGDTTERDPEIYGHFARHRPGQIRHIYLRNVTDEAAESERFKKAFNKVSKEKWTLFTDPRTLQRASAEDRRP